MTRDAKPPQAGDANAPPPEEIRGALQRSGFPLEIRLYSRFVSEPNVYVKFNKRTRPDADGVRREVDLLAVFRPPPRSQRPEGTGNLRAGVRVLVEAKGFPPGGAFVALTPHEEPPAPEWLVVERCAFAGNPSCRSVRGVDACENAVINSDVAESFRPICEGANISMQWVVVRRKSLGGHKFESFADHDDAFHKGLETLGRAAREMDVDYTTSAVQRNGTSVTATLQALVVPVGRLFEANGEGEPRAVKRTLLHRPVDIGDRVEHQVVDVFTEDELPAMIDRYQQLRRNLEANLAKLLPSIAAEMAEDRASLEEHLKRQSFITRFSGGTT